MENPTTHVMLGPELAEDIKDALTAAVGQLEYLGDPGESTRMCIEAGEAALERFREAREQPQAANVMAAALETFSGPLRLATILLEQASDGDLDSLSRHHTLALAVAVDDWKTRAEVRMMEFERQGPEKSGTG